MPKPAAIRMVWALTILLSAIGVTVAARRMAHILSAPAPSAALDAGFERHPLLTMIHIVPGLLFVTLGPLQFVPKLRARRPGVHRWTGRVVLASGIVIGVTALVMSPRMAIGGANETAATMLFATLFLFALGRAFAAILRAGSHCTASG